MGTCVKTNVKLEVVSMVGIRTKLRPIIDAPVDLFTPGLSSDVYCHCGDTGYRFWL
jgi:hypothetical protein